MEQSTGSDDQSMLGHVASPLEISAGRNLRSKRLHKMLSP